MQMCIICDLFQAFLAKLFWENGFTKNLGQNQTSQSGTRGSANIDSVPRTQGKIGSNMAIRTCLSTCYYTRNRTYLLWLVWFCPRFFVKPFSQLSFAKKAWNKSHVKSRNSRISKHMVTALVILHVLASTSVRVLSWLAEISVLETFIQIDKVLPFLSKTLGWTLKFGVE